MAKLSDVTDFFIQLFNAEERGEGLSNMKLQKLLYYAQGVHLARTGKPLFDETIKAWDYGPVVPQVYRKYRWFGNGAITAPKTAYDNEVFDDSEIRTLFDVSSFCEPYSAVALMKMSHAKGSPWDMVYAVNRYGEIRKDSLREYFSREENKVPSLFDLTPGDRNFRSGFETTRVSADVYPLLDEDDDPDEWNEYENEM
ncbi:MAG: DUF4065 domain-containing protein [Clostridiales bacterium]|jgi:uncharacterized phage-associated protein|nr:DUF4065 domain-containing protein [Clostridiales bacterium]